MTTGPFDNFARVFSLATTRRRAVMLVGALVGGVAAPGPETASRRVACRPNRSGCTRHAQCCGGYCEMRPAVPRRDRFRCSVPPANACGNGFCSDGEVCSFGVCIGTCQVAAPASSCHRDRDGAVYQSCGVTFTYVDCQSNEDCATASSFCALPNNDCFCQIYWYDGFYESFDQGTCIASAKVHPTAACNWLNGAYPDGPCSTASNCTTFTWDPVNTTCVSGVCVYGQ